MENQDLEEIKKIVTQNSKQINELYALTRKTHHYIVVGRILSLLKILLIIVPIILAVIYLPPFIQGITAPYQDLLGGGEKGLFDSVKQLQGTNFDKLLNK